MSGIRHVAIVGRDAAAWLAALSLGRAFRSGPGITVVELPPRLHPSHVFSTVPSVGGLHRVLGIPDARAVAASSGVPVLAQRFTGWSGAGSAFFHGYDVRGPSVGDIELLQYWVMARQQGMELPYEAFSIAATAARKGRLPRPDAESETLGDLAPGYHFSARPYVELVGGTALAAGVAHRRSETVQVETDGERIVAVTLADGERVEADLFIDASGPEALLLGRLPGAEVEDWARWLPANQLLMASAPRLHPLPGFAQIAAFQAGWLGMFPLQDRTGVVAAFDSALVSPEDMVRTASAVVGTQLSAAAVTPFRAGARPRPWIGNCVAIGEAAARLEPLDGVELHLVHLALSHLIGLFPVDSAAMPEAEAYNLVVGANMRNIRDFQAAHYKLNQRVGETYWDAARAALPSPELAHRIETFAARGVVPVYDDDMFETHNWAALFTGHGLVPRSYAPQVDETPRGETSGKFQAYLDALGREVDAMPPVEAWLRGGSAPAEPVAAPTGLY